MVDKPEAEWPEDPSPQAFLRARARGVIAARGRYSSTRQSAPQSEQQSDAQPQPPAKKRKPLSFGPPGSPMAKKLAEKAKQFE